MDKAKLCTDEHSGEHYYILKTTPIACEGGWFANKTAPIACEEGWSANKTAPFACEGVWFINKTASIVCEYPSAMKNYALFALNKSLILHYLKFRSYSYFEPTEIITFNKN